MPYKDRRGRLAGVRFRPGKRWRQERLRCGRDAPKVLSMPGGRSRLYGAEALRGATRGGIVHVAEGEIDTESLREYNVVAVGAPGASIWRSEWTRWLTHRGVARAVLWFDGDDAGDRGGAGLRDKLRAAGLEVFRLQEHGGHDVNDLHLSDLLSHTIREAEA